MAFRVHDVPLSAPIGAGADRQPLAGSSCTADGETTLQYRQLIRVITNIAITEGGRRFLGVPRQLASFRFAAAKQIV